MHVGWEGTNCGTAAHKEWHNLVEAELGPFTNYPTGAFEYSHSFLLSSEYDFEGLGTYVVCAVTVKSEHPAETSASFTVVEITKAEVAAKAAAEAKKQKEVAEAKAAAEAEVAAKKKQEEAAASAAATKKHQEEEAAKLVKPVVKPVSKLAKTLKQCKKQYKHNKKKLDGLSM